MLDGEIVALEPSGRPRFGLLQERLHVQTPPASLVARVPVIFYVFDILALDGEPIIALSYLQRRALLDTLGLASEHVRVPPHWEDVAGNTMLGVAREHGLEGIVAKRVTSIYRPGARSKDWIKTPLRNTTEVVIGGWTPGEGRRTGMIGALLVGAHDDTGQLVYLGHVGTGLPRPPCDGYTGSSPTWSGQPARSPSHFRATTPAAPIGWSLCWSATSSTASSPPANIGCGTPPGKDCGPTSRR
jgi:bifunctional non-homologous end joining protein LigD